MIWSVGWLNWRQFLVRRWWKLVPPSVWVHEWPSSILLKTSKSGLNVFWLLSVGLRGLGVHFRLGLHSVGKKKLLYFSSKNAKKDDKKRQKSDQKPLRRLSLYCSARARRTQWQRKLQPAWKNIQVRLPNPFHGYNHPSLSYYCHIDQLIERLAEEN